MSKTKKVLALLLASMLTAASMAGCQNDSSSGGSSGDSGEGQEGTTTVNFYGASDMDKTAEAEIEAFMKENENIKVEYHSIPNDDYDDKIKVMLSGGSSDIDALWIRTPAQTKQYMNSNVLKDLSPLAEDSGLDLSAMERFLS